MRNKIALFVGLSAVLVGCAPQEEEGGSNFNPSYQIYAPAQLSLSKTSSYIDVEWQGVDNRLAVSYVLQRKSNVAGSEFADLASLEEGALTFRDNQGLQTGKRYYYRLKVVSENGGEVLSDEASIVFGTISVPDTPQEEQEVEVSEGEPPQ